jgi:substrate import-associated zinc metallohydrolase lipoprotein
MAKLVKYLWFDVYGTVAGPDFLKENGPRIIHLIGSPAYNPVSQTMLLGTAEGGIKVTLYRCNEIVPTDIDLLNEYYFRTMHHEFAHILHQKRNYPVDFGLISKGKYNPLGWQYVSDSEAATMGFVTPYAGSQNREDFVEIIANYLVRNDAQWNQLLEMASKPGVDYNGTVLPDDGVDGKALIIQKLAIARKWLKDSWSIDLDLLRAEIFKRQATIDQALK